MPQSHHPRAGWPPRAARACAGAPDARRHLPQLPWPCWRPPPQPQRAAATPAPSSTRRRPAGALPGPAQHGAHRPHRPRQSAGPRTAAAPRSTARAGDRPPPLHAKRGWRLASPPHACGPSGLGSPRRHHRHLASRWRQRRPSSGPATSFRAGRRAGGCHPAVSRCTRCGRATLGAPSRARGTDRKRRRRQHAGAPDRLSVGQGSSFQRPRPLPTPTPPPARPPGRTPPPSSQRPRYCPRAGPAAGPGDCGHRHPLPRLTPHVYGGSSPATG